MFKLFNKSSEAMDEVTDNSIDLVITSPPFNLGTEYIDFKDKTSHENYKKMLGKVFGECLRVLNQDGRIVVEVSDTSFSSGRYIALSALVQSICSELGFSLAGRHINFAKTKDGAEQLDHGWEADYTTSQSAHSNCTHFLVFSKEKQEFDPAGQVFYSTYLPDEIHPCPFPEKHIEILLDLYFKKGMSVLDPFMGLAPLGAEVLKRGGDFYGYEIVKEFYDKAEALLKK